MTLSKTLQAVGEKEPECD